MNYCKQSGSVVGETFVKCSILLKANSKIPDFEREAGENFNHRHTLSISRIKI